MSHPSPENCATCPAHNVANLVKLGVDMKDFDFVVALAGNPNTGKTTVFNELTGLRQHTGNWPGKTVVRAEGAFAHEGMARIHEARDDAAAALGISPRTLRHKLKRYRDEGRPVPEPARGPSHPRGCDGSSARPH